MAPGASTVRSSVGLCGHGDGIPRWRRRSGFRRGNHHSQFRLAGCGPNKAAPPRTLIVSFSSIPFRSPGGGGVRFVGTGCR
jgi:hypothetical protein